MGIPYPKYPDEVLDGDERTYSPHKTTDSLLAAERGTDFTRRLETDASRNLYVNIAAGTVSTIPVGTGVSAVARISVGSGAVVTLSASNAAKRRVIIYNEAGTLFVKFGTSASSTNFTYTMPPNTTVETDEYYGIVTARKLSGTTFVDVTEVGI